MSFAYYLLLLCGSFIAALISGVAGFGGGLLLLPLLIKTVGADIAVPLLTISQIIGNLSRVFLGRHQIQWRPVIIFLLGAAPMSLLGALLFIEINKILVTRITGFSIIIFVFMKYFDFFRIKPGNKDLFIGGIMTGLISGMIGSAGPLGASIFLSLNMSPSAYISSEATTAFIIHIFKIIIYQKYIDFKPNILFFSVLLGFSMIAGTFTGKKLVDKISPEQFRFYVGIFLIIISLQMVFI